MTQTLQRAHRIRPGQPDDFAVRDLTEIAAVAEESSRVMELLLPAIASISLLVGGIGIMNILLVSVRERTREIGVRMAIGARRVHVLLQFLVEAALLSLMGGSAGAGIGIVASKVISLVAGWPTLLHPAVIAAAFLFSAAIGVFFGWYPARQASLLNPIDALRKNLELVQREFDAGKVAKSDVLSASAQLASDRTQLPALRQQLSVARHALAVLSSRAPGEWAPPDFDFSELTLPHELPLSVPSQLVRQRPDILAAEALLHADTAAIGIATAQLYPSITLSASFTRSSGSLPDLFGSAGSDVLGGGGTLDVPLFHGGALEAEREAAVDAYRAQLATWEQIVLQAFGQVADSLTALEEDGEAVATSREALDIAGASLELQRLSFAAGKTSALQLIVAENTYSTARLGYVRAQGQQMTDTAQLLVAVGGGWWNGADSGQPAH